MKPEKIFLADLDGTLLDYEAGIRNYMSALRSPNEPDLEAHPDNAPDWYEARLNLIRRIPGWWKNLPPITGNLRVVKYAKSIGFRLVILTKGPRRCPNAWTEKLEWCQKHLGEDVDVTITMDKGLQYGTVLFDDYPEYMDRWLKWRPRGLGIMPHTKQNANYSHPNVMRFTDYYRSVREIHRVIDAAYHRGYMEPLAI